MHLVEHWKKKGGPTLSFEVYPPRTEKQAARFPGILDKLVALAPDFFGVTFGAGGSTREGSRDLVRTIVKDKGIPVVAYVACYGLGPDALHAVLRGYRDIGVETVLAVRGDPPQGDETFAPDPESLPHASDFVRFARTHYDFTLGVAGYPEGHIDAESREADLGYLKKKLEEGAQFVIANYCYDNAYYFDFVAACRSAGIEAPIWPGVMPIYSVKMTESLCKLCGASIPEPLRRDLAALPEGDKAALSDFSVDLAVSQCRGLLEGGAPGVHLYTMNRAKTVAAVVTRLREAGLLSR